MDANEQPAQGAQDVLLAVNEKLLVASVRAHERADDLERGLFEGLPDAIARFDVAGRYLYANAAEERSRSGLAGAARGCRGHTHGELGVDREVAAQWTTLLRACFATGQPSDTLVKLGGHPGRFLLVRAFRRDEDDAEGRSVVTASRDVTDSLLYQDALAHADEATFRRREAEARLLQERALRAELETLTRRQRSLLLALPDEVIVLDDDGTVRDGNGVHPSGVAAPLSPSLSAALTQARERVAVAAERARELGVVQTLSVQPTLPGAVAAFELRVAPFDQAGVLCVARDSTELTLFRARAAFNDRLVTMGTVAASVAHEVNNPLAALSLSMELLLEGLTYPPHVSLALDVIDSARRIRAVVGALRPFSRRDESASGHDPVDLDAVVQSALHLVRSHFDGMQPPVYVPTKLSAVLGNATTLGQVIVNLLVNAAEAVRRHGTGRVEVRLFQDAEGVHAIVADNGGGLSEAAREHLFEAFFTTRKEGVGTGLGLYISNGIVTSLGGKLFVDDAAGGGGCAFHVVLPVAVDVAPSKRPAPRSGSKAIPRALRILAIDDEPRLLQLYPRLLAPHDVTLAAGGPEGLAVLVGDQRFDLVLCDLRMPELSGAELYAAILRRWPALALRFALVTGGALDDDELQALVRGGVPLLAKPFDRQELAHLLAHFEPLLQRSPPE